MAGRAVAGGTNGALVGAGTAGAAGIAVGCTIAVGAARVGACAIGGGVSVGLVMTAVGTLGLKIGGVAALLPGVENAEVGTGTPVASATVGNAVGPLGAG